MPTQICPGCGARLDEPRRFCPECGAALAARAAAAAPTARLEPPAPARGDSRLLWVILAGVAAVGMLMLLSCAGLLLITMRSGLALPPASPTEVVEAPATPPTGAGGGGIATLPTPPAAPTPASTGNLLLYEDFSDPSQSALTAEGDEISRSGFEDGEFVIAVYDSDMIAWALTERSYSDLAIEADATFPAEAALITAAGLIFNYQDNQNFYLFSVSNDGYYALEIIRDDEWQTLIDWTESDLISPSRNTLRVETKGARITLKVNGDLLEATDDGSLRAGDAGLAVSSFDTGQVQVRFDNLLITRSP